MRLLLVLGWLSCMPSCGSDPVTPCEPLLTPGAGVEWLMPGSHSGVDVLFVIDNSRMMADKQEILARSIPTLMDGLVNPECIDGARRPAPEQPSSPDEPCPEGYERRFLPETDIHIGVITTSLGGHGADSCDPNSEMGHAMLDDAGRLITRGDPLGETEVDSWNDLGFLAWDPDPRSSTHMPRGETDRDRLLESLDRLIRGAGQLGCGYEAPLEAWYRFLVDPDPYDHIEVVDGEAVPQGTDEVLLEQRAAFLRPRTRRLVIMISDENDCSIRDGGQYFLAAQIVDPDSGEPYHLPKPRAACATDPNGPCCRSCGEPPGEGCDASLDECDGPLSNLEDHINLRCFDQKRRFGIDFLYPIDRYVQGLTGENVVDRQGNVVPNPIGSNPPWVVGIVGVPWQDVTRTNEEGVPDPLLGLRTDTQLEEGGWALMLGDPDRGEPPSDPLMVESIEPRSGTHPITGEPVAPPSAGPDANSINGHEYSNPDRDGLQYACIFPLLAPRDCQDPSNLACRCDPGNDDPLCHDGEHPDSGWLEYRAGAYPGTRLLTLLREVPMRRVVGSICPVQREDEAAADYGYRPILRAAIEKLMVAPPAPSWACLEAGPLPVGSDGNAACIILEARQTPECSCDTPPGRQPLPEDDPLIASIEADETLSSRGWSCFCRLEPATGEALTACHQDPSAQPLDDMGEPFDGWCYLDATQAPPNTDPAMLAICDGGPALRYLGYSQRHQGAALLIACQDPTNACE